MNVALTGATPKPQRFQAPASASSAPVGWIVD